MQTLTEEVGIVRRMLIQDSVFCNTSSISLLKNVTAQILWYTDSKQLSQKREYWLGFYFIATF